ncbi:MAG: ABC transporter substrate-binding protein [Bilifractor sp.]
MRITKQNKRYTMLTAIMAASILLTGCGSSGNGSVQGTAGDSGVSAVSSGVNTAQSGENSSSDSAAAVSSSDQAVTTSSNITGTENTVTSVSDSVSASEIMTNEPDGAPTIDGLTYEGTMKLQYAKCFNVYYYQDGYKLISIPDSGSFLVVPDGKDAPSDLSDDYTVLHKPSNIYLAATSAYALFDALQATDAIKLSGTDTAGWTIDAPKKALEDGSMTFAGKYNEPDYEALVDAKCDLAIESTMILQSPEVQEMIEDLGIPVLTDRSSYETEALGRTEWIKLYGALMGREQQAFAYFDEQVKVLKDLEDEKSTGKTVAFFSIDTNGSVIVRTGDDYIANMIEEGGAKYIFDDLKSTGTSATVKLSMEEFYKDASDADYLIYNATIEGSLGSVSDLVKKNDLLSDFKAVKNGNVFQVDRKMYQSTDKVAQFIKDVNLMVTGGDEKQMTFLAKLS